MITNTRLLARELLIKEFRAFRNVSIPLGRRITVISGMNGVGKSNILSLIASGSGLGKPSLLGSNFQPEFYAYFNIDAGEPFQSYNLYLQYCKEDGDHALTKKLTFKDDTSDNRGIRIVPRTIDLEKKKTTKEAEKEAKDIYGVGGAARVKMPTIYLSLSRLYPLGERTSKVSSTVIPPRNPFSQAEYMEKYREWYNFVIPGVLRQDTGFTLIEKEACSRKSLTIDLENIPTLSQSVGQDNVGHIISALVDLYRLSKEESYRGAVLCIDEIEVSLHPDTQIKLLDLLDKLSIELNLQIFFSTHSLTVLEECLRKEEKNEEDYRVVYLKNPSSPYISEIKSFELLKADMYNQFSYNKIRVRVYYEDSEGYELFKLLIKAYRGVLSIIKSKDQELRAKEKVSKPDHICERILSLQDVLDFAENINPTVTHLGCNELLQISKVDYYFNRIIIILDGDARLRNNKPRIRDYLDNPFEPEKLGLNDIEHKPNIMFNPGYFAPESFLYRIIRSLCINQADHPQFWRGLDAKEETALYTGDKIHRLFSSLPEEYNNDDIKGIFGNIENGEVWGFIRDTEVLSYYYSSYENVGELLDYLSDFERAFKMTYPLTLSNRYT